MSGNAVAILWGIQHDKAGTAEANTALPTVCIRLSPNHNHRTIEIDLYRRDHSEILGKFREQNQSKHQQFSTLRAFAREMEPKSTSNARCLNGHGTSVNLVELRSLLNDAIINYERNRPKSLSIHKNALEVLPGGNTRSVLYTDPFPICMDLGKGNRLVDVDGHE
jgi:hypothetical protein